MKLAPALLLVTSLLQAQSATERLTLIEKRMGCRLGVAALDTASGKRLDYKSGERFAMCSTFKLLLTAAVLARVDQGREKLDRRIAYGPSDLLEWAPVARTRVKDGGETAW